MVEYPLTIFPISGKRWDDAIKLYKALDKEDDEFTSEFAREVFQLDKIRSRLGILYKGNVLVRVNGDKREHNHELVVYRFSPAFIRYMRQQEVVKK